MKKNLSRFLFSHIGTVISLQKLFRIDGPLVRGLTLITNLILLNTLFIITSIPLVTMGASVTSLNTMLHRILKGDDGDIIYHYFRIFKSNFKQATVIWAARAAWSSTIFELQYFFEYKLLEWIWIIASSASWNACDIRRCHSLTLYRII